MKRYDFCVKVIEAIAVEDGEFVKVSDAEAALAEKDARIKELEDFIEKFTSIAPVERWDKFTK